MAFFPTLVRLLAAYILIKCLFVYVLAQCYFKVVLNNIG